MFIHGAEDGLKAKVLAAKAFFHGSSRYVDFSP